MTRELWIATKCWLYALLVRNWWFTYPVFALAFAFPVMGKWVGLALGFAAGMLAGLRSRYWDELYARVAAGEDK